MRPFGFIRLETRNSQESGDSPTTIPFNKPTLSAQSVSATNLKLEECPGVAKPYPNPLNLNETGPVDV